MCVLEKNACRSLALACILTGIIAALVLNKTNTFSGQSKDILPISSQNLCEELYQGFYLNGGEFFIVFVQEDGKAVA